MPKTKAKKPIRPTAVYSLELVGEMLNKMRDLDVEDRFMLAATIDWIRTVWKGADWLQKPGAVGQGVAWIEMHAKELRRDALIYAAETAVVAAVTS